MNTPGNKMTAHGTLIAIAIALSITACSEASSSPGAGEGVDSSDSGATTEVTGEVDADPIDDTTTQDTLTQDIASGDVASDASLEDTATTLDTAPDTTPGLDTLADSDASAEDAGPPLSDAADVSDAQEPDNGGPADVPPPEPDAEEPDAPPPAAADPYLLSIDNSTHTLQKVNVTTGATTDVCQLNTTQTYPSLTFSRFNGLYGSRDGSQLDRIDPCTCTISPIGSYGGYSGIYGITADKSDNLFGVATVQDWLVSISTESGQGTGLGPLGFDFTTSGGTWSDADGTLYAISGGDDGLYTVDPVLGTATLLSTLNYDFGTVGIELHPANGVIYACSSAGHLLSVDPNGQVTDIGDMNQGGSCTNLAAPWLQVPCLDGI